MARDRYLQAIRGLAIACVVCIHCLPQCAASVVLRPFLNWAVAGFLFLSRLLTSESKILRGGVAKRLHKVLIPYLVWSGIYLVVTQRLTAGGIVKGVLFGTSSAQMYYLLVYAQLVMLTPLLYRVLRSHRLLVYCVTPVFLLVREVAAIVGVALPQVQVLFPAWLLFYVLGLDWGKVGRVATRRCSLLPGLLVACLFLQLVSGFAWLARGDYNMATTQLKLSSMATSAVLVVLIGLTGHRLRQLFARSYLVKLGDLSFGIYLCHILVLGVVTKVLGFVAIPALMATVVNLAVTLVVSACVVAVGATLLPRKVCEALGFV
ncbi:acyltransferase [Collinsella aerofaciens]|uniref:acyltransferase n=1 Tax=Collinsella aerofaciens TaxID=74426 RepID=UPI0034A10821